PGFPIVTDPNLGQHALDWSYSVSATAFTSGGSKSDGQTIYPGPNSSYVWGTTAAEHGTYDLGINNLSDKANTNIDGSVGGGELHALAVATTDNGPASTSARVIVDFIDHMVVTRSGIPKFTFQIHGGVTPDGNNEMHIPGDGASGGGTTQLYVFPDTGVQPPA